MIGKVFNGKPMIKVNGAWFDIERFIRMDAGKSF
jgi:hypothetical protein